MVAMPSTFSPDTFKSAVNILCPFNVSNAYLQSDICAGFKLGNTFSLSVLVNKRDLLGRILG